MSNLSESSQATISRPAEGRERRLTLPDGRVVRFVADYNDDETVLFDRGHVTRPDDGYEAPFQVYAPHTVKRPLTMAAMPLNARWVDVGETNVSYFAALLDWWSKGETFAIIEHDVCPTPEVFAGFDECSDPWCCHWYSDGCHLECREGWRNLIGCTRYRAELMAAVPDAVSSIPESGWDWRNLCDGLGNHLREAGYSQHWHEPAVLHSHEPL